MLLRGFLYAVFFPLRGFKALTKAPSCRYSCFLELICCRHMQLFKSASSSAKWLNLQTLPLSRMHICMPACSTKIQFHTDFHDLQSHRKPRLSQWICVDTEGCWDLERCVYTSRNDPLSSLCLVCVVCKHQAFLNYICFDISNPELIDLMNLTPTMDSNKEKDLFTLIAGEKAGMMSSGGTIKVKFSDGQWKSLLM